MTRERYTARTFPAGAPATGLTYSIVLHADGSTLATGTTDASGQALYTADLSPGPHYFSVTDTAPTPDSVRVVSSTSTGSGGAYSLAELPFVLRAMGSGVVRGYANACEVTYDGAGLDLDTNTGSLMALGIPTVINASIHQTVSSALRDASNPKQCYWCAVFTGPGETEEGKVVLAPVCGTAAASPSLPALTQNEVLWQLPLATFRLPISSSTTLSQLTDARSYLMTRNPVLSSVDARTDPESVATTTSTTGDSATSLISNDLVLLNGVTYDINVRGSITCKISAVPFQALMTVTIAASSIAVAPFIGTTSTSYINISNAVNVTAIGDGTPIACGVVIKVTGGTMSYTTGVLDVTAVPRT